MKRFKTFFGQWGLVGAGSIAIFGCSQGPVSQSEDVSESSEALTNANPAGDQDQDKAVVVFRGAVQCLGAVIATDTVLTTQHCVEANAAGYSVLVGNAATTQFKASSGASSANATVLPASTGLKIVQFSQPLSSTVGDVVPVAVSTATVMAGITPGTLSGVEGSTGNTPNRTRLNTTVGQADVLPKNATVEFCMPDGGFFQDPGDEGMPFFESTGAHRLLGLIDTNNKDGECAGTTESLIPAQSLPRFVAGNFDGTVATSFFATLGTSGPMYQLSVSRGSSLFTANTGIPVGLGVAGLLNATPSLTSGEFIDSPENAANYTDLKVTLGALPATTDPPLNGGEAEVDNVTPIPPTNMGMGFLLSGEDVVSVNNGTVSVLPSWKGFPTPDAKDGRFLSLNGNQHATAQVAAFRGFLSCPTAGTDRFQIFDGDNTGGLDQAPATPAFHTCVKINVDPDKTFAGDDPSQTDATCVVNVEGSSLPDNDWSMDMTLPITCANAHLGDRTRNYRVEVFFAPNATTCANAQPSTSLDATELINRFKIRSTCNIETTLSTFSFVAMEDQDAGDKGGLFHPLAGLIVNNPVPDAWYQLTGGFSFLVDKQAATGSASADHITLRNADADDCDIADCDGSGASKSIHFLGFDEGGTARTITREVPATPPWSGGTNFNSGSSLRDMDPSGNFTGVPQNDATGVRRFNVGMQTDRQTLAVLWRNIRVENTVTDLAPTGSPVVFPVLSNDSVWTPVVSSLTPAQWAANPTALAPLLPLELGDPGGRRTATTVAQAQALLNPNDFTARVAAAVLNQKRTRAQNRDLENAVIRGTSTLVSDALQQANRALIPPISPPAALTGLLDAINTGLVLFSYTSDNDLDPAADPDVDGIPSVTDNCPTVFNPNQEDTVLPDEFGDACDPTPIVECVLPRGTGRFTAFFGHNTPLRNRRLKDPFNTFTTGATNRGQSPLLLAGRHRDDFSVDFNGSPLSWRVAGSTATASSNSPVCTGAEVTLARVNQRVAFLATDRIQLGDRFKLPTFDAMAAGPGGVTTGFDSILGDLSTTGGVTTQRGANIQGTVRLNGTLTLNGSNAPKGLVIRPAGVQIDDIGVTIAPVSHQTLAPVPITGSLTLAPGNYQSLVVGRGATVNLRTGTYDFNTIQLDNDVHLVLNDTAGLVRIVVRNSYSELDRRTLSATSGPAPKVLLLYLGTSRATLNSAFSGSIVAPNAEIHLFDRVTYAGTLFARSITGGTDIRATFVPLLVPGSP